MAIFTVKKVVDAFVFYDAEIEADSAEAAAEYAYKHEDQVDWGTGDVSEYDARKFVTVDERGNELEETQQGDML